MFKLNFRPTVGVDPILRNKIWDFLQTLSSTTDTTVIISTQYIQETINATTIGFIRNGNLLIQEKPQNIIKNLWVSNLEEAFYKLSFQQGEKNDVNRKCLKTIQSDNKLKKIPEKASFDVSFNRMIALLSKNQILQRRNIM